MVSPWLIIVKMPPSRPCVVRAKMPTTTKPEVRDRRVRDQPFQVRLHGGDDGAVDDADRPQHEEQRREVDRGLREEREREAQEPVGAHLEQHAGQDHRPRRRRLGVRVGQPGVQREQGHLHREGGEEGEEQPLGGALVETAGCPRGERAQVEGEVAGRGLVQEPEREEADEQERRARHRVEEELQRRVVTPVVTPPEDDEVHRDEDDLEEHEEHDEVERRGTRRAARPRAGASRR